MSIKDTEFKNHRSVDFSVWTQFAEEAGATFIRDRIGNIDGNGDAFTTGEADNAQVKEIVAKYNADKDFWFVKLSGSGVGGNAVARFDDQADAEAFATNIDGLREAGILDDVLMDGFGLPGAGGFGPGSGWMALAALVGNEKIPVVNLGKTDNPEDLTDDDTLVFVRDLVSSIDPDQFVGATSEVSENDAGEFGVRVSGGGVGGNAVARFDNEADAEAFKALADLQLNSQEGVDALFGAGTFDFA